MGVYRAPGGSRRRIVVLGAVVVLVLMTSIVFRQWPLVLRLLWFVILMAWLQGRLVRSIAVTPTSLRWRSTGRAGEIPLAEVVRVSPYRFGPAVVVIEHRGGKLLVPVAEGMQSFLDALAFACPGLVIEVTVPGPGTVTVGDGSWWRPDESTDLR
jgi:hypothetical protein